MSLYFAYQPALSFIGKWWWHEGGSYIHPFEWKASGHLLKPLWVGFEIGDGEDGYLRVDPLPDVSQSPTASSRGRGVVYDTFWFAAYKLDGRYYFQVRPVQGEVSAGSKPLPWVLKSDTVGYMGMYHTWFNAPEWAIYLSGDMWQWEGLALSDLVEGELCQNLRLADYAGNKVSKRDQFGRPYLYSGSWTGNGRFSLHVLKRPFTLLPTREGDKER